MRSLILAAVVCAGPVWAEDVDGRFHIEVAAVEGASFLVSVTPTDDPSVMVPVNEVGLHLSCFAMPDVVADMDVWRAASAGAGRYCRAQFGEDQVAEVAPFAQPSLLETRVFNGACFQAPM